MPNPNDLIPARHCAPLAGLSYSRFYALEKQGDGPPVTRVDGKRYVRRAALERWMAKRAAERSPHRRRVESGLLRSLISTAALPDADKATVLDILTRHGLIVPSSNVED